MKEFITNAAACRRMNPNRRTFLRLGSVLVAGTALLPRSLFALGKAGGLLDRLSLSGTDQAVLDFTARYASSVRLIGGSILGKLRGNPDGGMRVLVEVRNLEALEAALATAPFKNIFARENTLSFTLQGTERAIENLFPELFAARLAELADPQKTVFAHDALVYDPATQQLSDPFGAVEAGEVKLMNRPAKTAAALEVALRGTWEAHAAGLREGDTFGQWRVTLLNTALRSDAAPAVAAAFVRALPAFAAVMAPDDVKTALRSRLVTTALQPALGLDVNGAIAAFDKLRATFGQSYSDAGVWFFVVLKKQLETNAPAWITTELVAEEGVHQAFATARLIEAALKDPRLKSST